MMQMFRAQVHERRYVPPAGPAIAIATTVIGTGLSIARQSQQAAAQARRAADVVGRLRRVIERPDQRLGGVIMWVPAGLIPLAAFTAVFFRWAAAEHEADDDAEEGVLRR